MDFQGCRKNLYFFSYRGKLTNFYFLYGLGNDEKYQINPWTGDCPYNGCPAAESQPSPAAPFHCGNHAGAEAGTFSPSRMNN